MSGISAIKGFNDILPDSSNLWQQIEKTARNVFETFGFGEIRVPILEKTELFARSIGDTTDIVEKEMYTFSDKGGHSLTLRPEGTASVMRSIIENKLYATNSINKLYYMGPMFRHERPQKGRYRQFHQIGAELVGTTEPLADAQLLLMASRLFKELGLDEPQLQINSLGCPNCRPAYRSVLIAFLEAHSEQLCDDCIRRQNSNPLRALDCKIPTCVEATIDAPSVIDHLCSDCSEHFKKLQDYLLASGVNFTVNRRMVRGLDYYTRTTFEIVTKLLGSQSAVAAGGRYDGLVEQLGGPSLPGIGFALGVERIALLLGDAVSIKVPNLFVALLGDESRVPGFTLVSKLQEKGVWIETDCEGKSLKSQMRRADKLGSKFCMVIGSKELSDGTAVLKRMSDGTEQEVSIDVETIFKLITA